VGLARLNEVGRCDTLRVASGAFEQFGERSGARNLVEVAVVEVAALV